jgi:hypothetical protein
MSRTSAVLFTILRQPDTVTSKTASEYVNTDAEGRLRVDWGRDPIRNTYLRVQGRTGPAVEPAGVKLFSRSTNDALKPDLVDAADVARVLGVPYTPGDSPAIKATYAGRWPIANRVAQTLVSPAKLDRVDALHESTHHADPELAKAYMTRDGKAIPTEYTEEVPAMVSENVAAMRDGWTAKDDDWRYEAMKKYGPKLSPDKDLKKDTAAVKAFVENLRKPGSTLKRTYEAFLDAKKKDAVAESKQAYTPKPVAAKTPDTPKPDSKSQEAPKDTPPDTSVSSSPVPHYPYSYSSSNNSGFMDFVKENPQVAIVGGIGALTLASLIFTSYQGKKARKALGQKERSWGEAIGDAFRSWDVGKGYASVMQPAWLPNASVNGRQLVPVY